MAYFSGGATLLKWLDKLGDVGKVAARVMSRVDDALESVDDIAIPGIGAAAIPTSLRGPIAAWPETTSSNQTGSPSC